MNGGSKMKIKKMTMKKRLLISNVMMVAIPVAVMLLLLAFGMSTVGNRYWASMDAMYGDDNGLATVDNLMYSYADEFRNAVRNDMTPGQTQNQIKTAEKEFNDLGYTIELQSGGKTYYSGLKKSDKQVIKELVGNNQDSLDSFSIQRGMWKTRLKSSNSCRAIHRWKKSTIRLSHREKAKNCMTDTSRTARHRSSPSRSKAARRRPRSLRRASNCFRCWQMWAMSNRS